MSERTLYEMREEMRGLAVRGSDTEADHSRGDKILCEALRLLADLLPPQDPTLWPAEVEDLIGYWENMKKWYA